MITTLEQWEAEKARIDLKREGFEAARAHFVDALRGVGVKASDLPPTTVRPQSAAEVFPYPSKPEKTVTLSDGAEYRRSHVTGATFEYLVLGNWFEAWIVPGKESDIRALASLLPENQET